MPVRVWLWSAAIIGVAAIGLAALMIAVPDPMGLRDGASADVTDGVAPGDPGPNAGITEPPPELVADLAALAAERQAVVPGPHRPVLGGPTTLTLVSAAGRLLTFAYEVEIDMQGYTLRADPTELFPGLEARSCRTNNNGVCYVFTGQLAISVCGDATLRPLLERGAIVRYLFRDFNQRPLTDTSVAVTDCTV